MQIKASESIEEGSLVCLATGVEGSTILMRWRYGCEAVGIAARSIAEDEIVDFMPEKSSDDILVKGSLGPAQNKVIAVRAACDLKPQDLVCLKLLPDGKLLLDKWKFGQEAVGIAARRIKANESISFCEGESTADIHVKPHKASREKRHYPS